MPFFADIIQGLYHWSLGEKNIYGKTSVVLLKSLFSNRKPRAYLVLRAVMALSFRMTITVKLKLARNFSLLQQRVLFKSIKISKWCFLLWNCIQNSFIVAFEEFFQWLLGSGFCHMVCSGDEVSEVSFQSSSIYVAVFNSGGSSFSSRVPPWKYLTNFDLTEPYCLVLVT